MMSINKTLKPTSKRWSQPRDLNTSWIKLEDLWHTEITNWSDTVDQNWGHNDLTVNGKNHICHSRPDNIKNILETLNLLEEEDIKWNTFTSLIEWLWSLQWFKFVFNFNRYEIWWKELNQLGLEFVLNLIFTGATRATTWVLWLSVDKNVDHLTRFFESVGKISVGVKTENQRIIFFWEGIDVLKVTRMFVEVWNVIVVLCDQVVETVFLFEDILGDPEQAVS